MTASGGHRGWPRLPGFGRLCYNGAAVEGVKPSSAYQVTEERVLEETRVVEKPDSGGALSNLEAVPAGMTRQVPGDDDASRFCPVCSQRLESRRCKLICKVCGYYMSCADYY
jgi:hypothetical protein